MKIVWATDIHLDHCKPEIICRLVKEIKESKGDCLLLSGDIHSNGNTFSIVKQLYNQTGVPIHFVLGNHDFYGSSVKIIRSLHKKEEGLYYLTHENVFTLAPHVALIGHDGWTDGRSGNFETSTVQLNDFYYISELTGLSKEKRLVEIQKLSKESVDYLIPLLEKAFITHDHVLILTHVPPFLESALYEGETSNDDWFPFFVNSFLGKSLKETLSNYPTKKATVISGHTHHHSNFKPLPNLEVFVGQAEYGDPHLQSIAFLAKDGSIDVFEL